MRNGRQIPQKLARHFGFAINNEGIEVLKKLTLENKESRIRIFFSRDSLVSLIETQSRLGMEDGWPSPVNLWKKRLAAHLHWYSAVH